VDGDAVDLREIAERDGFSEQAQHVPATGAAEGTIDVVWGAVIPRAQAWRLHGWLEARRFVDVAEGQDVLGDRRVEGLLNTGDGEWPGYEESGGRI
jgi:hypothetical protein